jgi:hypothetical protein
MGEVNRNGGDAMFKSVTIDPERRAEITKLISRLPSSSCRCSPSSPSRAARMELPAPGRPPEPVVEPEEEPAYEVPGRPALTDRAGRVVQPERGHLQQAASLLRCSASHAAVRTTAGSAPARGARRRRYGVGLDEGGPAGRAGRRRWPLRAGGTRAPSSRPARAPGAFGVVGRARVRVQDGGRAVPEGCSPLGHQRRRVPARR